jgi:hypothetical protein
MSTSSSPHEAKHRSISLSRLATIFAVAFAIAFGLCAASATFGMGVNQKVAAGSIWASAAVECICLLGLLTTGIIALVRSIGAR